MKKNPKVLITKDQIENRILQLADLIRQDYAGKRLLLICILKGSFIFTADLVRCLHMPVEIDFIRVSSYGTGEESSGKVEVTQDIGIPIEGREVLLVEDIVDTGLSLAFLLDFLNQRGPASIKICALLDKPSRRKSRVHIDYLGFNVPDRFVVGYGIDHAEEYRWLPDVCYLTDD